MNKIAVVGRCLIFVGLLLIILFVGVQTASARTTINNPPTTEILSPCDNISSTNGASNITITGTASDVDVGDSIKVVQIKTVSASLDWSSDWINATDISENGDWSAWKYDWTVLPTFTHTNYTIYVRAYSGNGSKNYTDDYHLYSTVLSNITICVNNLPSCAIVTPTADSTVRGYINIIGSISDADGDRIQRVELTLDNGSVRISITNDPGKGMVLLSNSWAYVKFSSATYANGTYILNGSHTFSARAFDGMGYSPISTVTVKFDNHIPTVNITSLKENDIVTGVVTIAGFAKDVDYLNATDTIANVTLEITSLTDRQVIKTTSSNTTSSDKIALKKEDKNGNATWTYVWDTTSLIKGDYALRVWANSTNRERSLDYCIVVTANRKPNITIDLIPAPIPDGHVINGSAWDSDIGDSIQMVQVKIDNGEWINATDTAIGMEEPWFRWEYKVNTSMLVNGNHTLYARAFDIDDQHNTSKSTSAESKVIMTVDYSFFPHIGTYMLVNITTPKSDAAVSSIISVEGTVCYVEYIYYYGGPIATIDSRYLPFVLINNTYKQEDNITYLDGYVQNVEVMIVSISNYTDRSYMLWLKEIVNTGKWQNATGTNIWNCSLDTRTLPNGKAIIIARAFNGTSCSVNYGIIVNIDNKQPLKGFIPAFDIIASLCAVSLSIALYRKRKRL